MSWKYSDKKVRYVTENLITTIYTSDGDMALSDKLHDHQAYVCLRSYIVIAHHLMPRIIQEHVEQKGPLTVALISKYRKAKFWNLQKKYSTDQNES